MSLQYAARHLSVRSRMAHRRIRLVLARTTAPYTIGQATGWFSAVSVASHLVLTWGMVALASPPLPDASHDALVSSRFLYPLMRRQPVPVQERISYVGLGGRFVLAAGVLKQGGRADVKPELIAIAETSPPPPQEEARPAEVFSELEVDVAAARDPESIGPTYPDSLLALQIEGQARVRFIIDTTGHAAEGSFAVIETNEPGFAEAVRLALPRMKYRPASIGPKRVSQSVEQTFMFKLTRAPLIP